MNTPVVSRPKKRDQLLLQMGDGRRYNGEEPKKSSPASLIDRLSFKLWATLPDVVEHQENTLTERKKTVHVSFGVKLLDSEATPTYQPTATWASSFFKPLEASSFLTYKMGIIIIGNS